MRKIALALAILGTTLGTALYTAPAHAQATRTWVSGVGDDANPCSRTAPCKTWAGSIAKTAPGGEIDALDPGGFGGVTITKSITLDGGGGQVASVLVAGTNGIVVAAQSNDVVILRNLRFDGLLGNGTAPGNAGINGISYSSGAQLVVDNCDIFGFSTNGINMSTNNGIMEVRNTTFRNNGQNGINAVGNGGTSFAQIYNSSFVGTTSGGAPSQGGVTAGSSSVVTVANSNFQDLSYGAQTTGGTLLVDSSLFSSTSNGVLTAASTTANVSNNSFYGGNAFGGSGSFVTAGNNKIGSNSNQGSTNLTPMTVK